MELKPGDTISYYVNYRANGAVGGWQPHYVTGTVVKVNPKTVVVQRVGWTNRQDTVPQDRILPYSAN
jgi:hypothetical protein